MKPLEYKGYIIRKIKSFVAGLEWNYEVSANGFGYYYTNTLKHAKAWIKAREDN